MANHPTLDELLAQADEPPLASSTHAHEVTAAFARARQAQARWARLPTKQRGHALRRLAATLTQHRHKVARLISAETGKPQAEALVHEIFGAAALAHYFGGKAAKVLSLKRLTPSFFWHRTSEISYAPHGTVGIISPWNFPFALPFGDVAMALVAGNACVLKPSEHTPRCGQVIRALAAQAGIDPDLVQVVVGDKSVGQQVIAGPVQMVRFTGSVATGKSIAAVCGERLIPCVVELGGKDAAIVLADADIEHTARTLVYGAFANAGQVCASIERAYVAQEIFAPLVARVVELTQALKVAPVRRDSMVDPFDIGPMVVPAQGAHVAQQVDEAVAKGAQVLCGGKAYGDAYMPTVLVAVDDTMAICRDETFGPVLPMMAVSSPQEAVTRANASRYGLSAYVFGHSRPMLKKVAQQLEAGTVMVNEVLLTHAAPEAPWGGLKDSGLGHTHSDEGLKSFCQLRHINQARFCGRPGPGMFGYPYGPDSAQMVDCAMDVLFAGRSPVARLISAGRALIALFFVRPKR